MHNTTMGRNGRGVEYAGRIPGTSVGSFGVSSKLSRLPRPAVEKDCRGRRGWPVFGEYGDDVSNSSDGVGPGGRLILLGGVDVIAGRKLDDVVGCKYVCLGGAR